MRDLMHQGERRCGLRSRVWQNHGVTAHCLDPGRSAAYAPAGPGDCAPGPERRLTAADLYLLSLYADHRRQFATDPDPHRRQLATFINHYLVERQAGLHLPEDFFATLLDQGQHVLLLLDGLMRCPMRMNGRWCRRRCVTSPSVACRLAWW